MRLAILVVYLFDETTAPMVAVHLDRVRRHTSVPYTIYGSTALLDAKARAFLAEQGDDLILVDTSADSAEGWMHAEHGRHLNALRARAEMDGATHFATLHPDSFPVRDGWAETLIAGFERGDSFACLVPYAYNACLVWPASWNRVGGRLQPSPDERESAAFMQFLAEHPDWDPGDNGIGFLFDAWRMGLPRRIIEPTGSLVWGGMIMHLVGGARIALASRAPLRIGERFSGVRRAVRKGARSLPVSMRHSIYGAIRARLVDADASSRDGSPRTKREQIADLVEDPERFVAHALRKDPQPVS